MRTTRPFLAGVTVMICFTGVAVERRSRPRVRRRRRAVSPARVRPRRPASAPQPGYPPPQNQPPAPPPAEAHFGAAGQIAISDDLPDRHLAPEPELEPELRVEQQHLQLSAAARARLLRCAQFLDRRRAVAQLLLGQRADSTVISLTPRVATTSACHPSSRSGRASASAICTAATTSPAARTRRATRSSLPTSSFRWCSTPRLTSSSAAARTFRRIWSRRWNPSMRPS